MWISTSPSIIPLDEEALPSPEQAAATLLKLCSPALLQRAVASKGGSDEANAQTHRVLSPHTLLEGESKLGPPLTQQSPVVTLLKRLRHEAAAWRALNDSGALGSDVSERTMQDSVEDSEAEREEEETDETGNAGAAERAMQTTGGLHAAPVTATRNTGTDFFAAQREQARRLRRERQHVLLRQQGPQRFFSISAEELQSCTASFCRDTELRAPLVPPLSTVAAGADPASQREEAEDDDRLTDLTERFQLQRAQLRRTLNAQLDERGDLCQHKAFVCCAWNALTCPADALTTGVADEDGLQTLYRSPWSRRYQRELPTLPAASSTLRSTGGYSESLTRQWEAESNYVDAYVASVTTTTSTSPAGAGGAVAVVPRSRISAACQEQTTPFSALLEQQLNEAMAKYMMAFASPAAVHGFVHGTARCARSGGADVDGGGGSGGGPVCTLAASAFVVEADLDNALAEFENDDADTVLTRRTRFDPATASQQRTIEVIVFTHRCASHSCSGASSTVPPSLFDPPSSRAVRSRQSCRGLGAESGEGGVACSQGGSLPRQVGGHAFELRVSGKNLVMRQESSLTVTTASVTTTGDGGGGAANDSTASLFCYRKEVMKPASYPMDRFVPVTGNAVSSPAGASAREMAHVEEERETLARQDVLLRTIAVDRLVQELVRRVEVAESLLQEQGAVPALRRTLPYVTMGVD